MNRCFSSERPNFSVFFHFISRFYFHPSGNKTKLLGAHVLVGVKTPIHLLTYSEYLFSAPHCLEIKWKNGKLVLVGVKTPIHLFTYSPFFGPPMSGNKIEKWKTFLWSELKHLFAYSPIHLFLLLSFVWK